MEFSEAVQEIPRRLSEATLMEVSEAERERVPGLREHRPDMLLRVGSAVFWIEYKTRASAEAVGSALKQIELWRESAGIEPWSTLLVVPYMGQVGQSLCGRSNVNWMDLSGNAAIVTPGLHVNLAGRPNLHARRGRSPNLFAPKASRLSRVFLSEPDEPWSHHDLVTKTRLSKGYVSKILERLKQAGFIESDEHRRYWSRDREALLDAWRKSYRFRQQRILRGFVAERTPEAVLRRIVGGLDQLGTRVAATGLAAAWHYDRHASFRLCSVYAEPLPAPERLAGIGFQEADSGENAWIAEPEDEGVFSEMIFADGMPYVSPLQAYLDLQDHPERGDEAATVLRRRVMGND